MCFTKSCASYHVRTRNIFLIIALVGNVAYRPTYVHTYDFQYPLVAVYKDLMTYNMTKRWQNVKSKFVMFWTLIRYVTRSLYKGTHSN